jgi:hypothetical protein
MGGGGGIKLGYQVWHLGYLFNTKCRESGQPHKSGLFICSYGVPTSCSLPDLGLGFTDGLKTQIRDLQVSKSGLRSRIRTGRVGTRRDWTGLDEQQRGHSRVQYFWTALMATCSTSTHQCTMKDGW